MQCNQENLLGSVFLDFLLHWVWMFLLLSCLVSSPLFGVLIFRIGLQQKQRLPIKITGCFENFWACQFRLIRKSCVILLSIVIPDRIFVVVKDEALHGRWGVVFVSEVIELAIKTFLKQLENVFLLMLNANLLDGLLDGNSQGCFLHLVQLQLMIFLRHSIERMKWLMIKWIERKAWLMLWSLRNRVSVSFLGILNFESK